MNRKDKEIRRKRKRTEFQWDDIIKRERQFILEKRRPGLKEEYSQGKHKTLEMKEKMGQKEK